MHLFWSLVALLNWSVTLWHEYAQACVRTDVYLVIWEIVLFMNYIFIRLIKSFLLIYVKLHYDFTPRILDMLFINFCWWYVNYFSQCPLSVVKEIKGCNKVMNISAYIVESR